MEFFIYLVIGIIYAIASANGYNGRYSRNNFRLRNMEYGRYGLIGVDDDFSLSLDSRLDRIREEYNRRLQQYYASNTPRTYLKNNHCELRLIKDEKGIRFYCKEKSNGRRKGRFFEVQGNSEHAGTMWAIIDMEYNKRTDYQAVKALYYRLNQTSNTTGGLKYFYEPFFKKYPDYDEKHAQNEYCSMEFIDSEGCIFCSELWSSQPKQFKIKGNKYLLLNIISEFKQEKDKFQFYTKLLSKYMQRNDIQVVTIVKKSTDNYQQTGEVTQQKKSDKIKQKSENIDVIKTEEKQNPAEQKNIEKYDERNLDI